MFTVDQMPEGVREGNEKLLEVTSSAGAKLVQLNEREGKGEFLRVKITGVVVMVWFTKCNLLRKQSAETF